MVSQDKKRLQISLEKDLLAKTKALCNDVGLTVSEFIAICLENVVNADTKSEREIIADMVSECIKKSRKIPF